jgi:hypothetical protein
MTKSELKQMIREVLKEELSNKRLSEALTAEDRYIAIGGDFPNSYYVYTVTSDEEEAYRAYEEILYSGDYSLDLELAQLFDLTHDEIDRLESMIGKDVSGADAEFIASFFVDGSRVDSLHNNFD